MSDSTPIFQPYYDQAWSFFIGRRKVTATTFTNAQDAPCPATYTCKWSDAALGAYAIGVSDSSSLGLCALYHRECVKQHLIARR